jgi:hypothetical protein
MSAAPRFVFVPVSGPGGAGEYHRSLAIARGFERRWPGCTIRFVLNRAASYTAESPYPGLRIDDSPTRAGDAVTQYLIDERPDVVVFDSAGRLAQYRAARAAGAAVIYVSSRPKTRWKGFRLRRMRAFDQHWIAQPRFLGGEPTPYERGKLRLVGRPEIVVLDVLHEPIDVPGTRELQSRLGLHPGQYVLMCPGGGGTFGASPDAAQVFLSAAAQLAQRVTVPVVAVVGRRLTAESSVRAAPGNLHVLPALTNSVLIGMIREATVVTVNGGSLLLQSLAQGVPVVAAPIAGDQLARIRHCADHGYVCAAPLEAAALVNDVTGLLMDTSAREELRARLAQLALRDGVLAATEAVERLLVRRSSRHTEVRT